MSNGPNSPWLTLTEAAAYLHRGRRFVRAEVVVGRLRAATIGDRRQILTRAEWLDQWVCDRAAPVVVGVRRVSR